MEITFLGHSSFKLRGKNATVVTDPFDKSVGFAMPKVSADIVTISHDHFDHNNASAVTGTSRRDNPYVITAPGEYEVSGVGIFGWKSYHDAVEGQERGRNTMFSIHMEGIRFVHLGDIGHLVSEEDVEHLGAVDVLLVPVGGVYTIDAETAVKMVTRLQPSLVIPMHFKTPAHDPEKFGTLSGVDLFLKEMGVDEVETVEKLKLTSEDLPEEAEVVVLKQV